MDIQAIQIEMISVCSFEGKLRPLRFRFEDEEKCLQTISVTQVIDRREITYVGVEYFLFICKGTMQERERLFELRYAVRSHRWELFRMLY